KYDAGDRAEIETQLKEARQELADVRRAASILKISSMSTMNPNTGLSWFDARIKDVQDNPKLYAYKVKTAAYKFSWALI
ncbi:hypothetical protein, partial [Pseudomonas sp. AH2 (2023)]|uniref:hypothetical protein n=1 Tax=Pseudomonas sp. AH2 (2023) TaxID=3048599 RepID=UPI002B23D1F6